MLRIHKPGPAPKPYRPFRLTGEAMPLMYRQITQQTPFGPCVDHLLTWRQEQAADCRLCPLSKCTLEVADGIGSCIVRTDRDGRLLGR